MQGLETLRESLMARAQLTEADFAMIFEKARFKQFDKGSLLTTEGKVENYISFVMDGMVRVFFYKDDKDNSLDFFFTGSFVSAYESFLTRTPTNLNLEALSPVTLLQLHYDDLQVLYDKSPKLQQAGRVLTEEIFRRLSQRIQDLLSLSASERYHKLLEAQPEYVQNIPLKYLASYLNVTPESLSRIRKGIL